ncbi:putative pentatricopeptide repeat-containing protein At3g47840 [Rhodamnia argentea]|uniref:Pentatricopeptide repeat-containing protein At3g47840 n=1 Tax=Rhodamnia argentea TaxID=178133 RepID=A0A8B8NME8_9MYRT|nr:putative pentatricopeptide repeat-containing protein At3g47840 [Rhodamnia argentea]XP_048128670.1 putative pentatricopeptide repeat-containing protein At3g47840 [Rhodamnia argentea]XP_048128671.1 putative pentatricopeptide repeat-containing protein At3g47840 [Rhodamnia argentea]XP_048128672.1 putative pentatricopeptide repeat-containing protein At3g47840 [Rhodamnia argentea]XP_048128673.1 putative pentatricopeptide repeat-containing protein At3g47840 [Rhodamnia argentea]XP_048128674.1 putat
MYKTMNSLGRPRAWRLFSSSSMPCADQGHVLFQEMRPDRFATTSNIAGRPNMPEANSRLKELVKLRQLSHARRMFDNMPHRDEISWTTMISGYVAAMNAREALGLFLNVWVAPGLKMDPFILSLALKACGLDVNLNLGESLHGYAVKTGLVNSVFVGSTLLDMYTKTGRTELGCWVFDEMPLRNVVSWTAIITGLVHSGRCREGLSYFSKMWRSKVQFDTYSFAIALKACADLGALDHGREIHTHTVKNGFVETSFVANTLVTMYNKCGKLDYGLRLFERMPKRDVVSWTSIISTYIQMGQEESAIRAFLKMRESDASPNAYTFAAVISGCANLTRIDWGEQLHAHVLCIGLSSSLSVANSVMTMYSKCGQLTLASIVFNEMTTRDVVSWSTLIAGYSNGVCGEETFELLSLMRREGPKPTEFALASILSVCGNMAILDSGKQLHAHVLLIGLEHTPMIQSALINMYGKCGCVKEASQIFDVATSTDIISWTAMINEYAEHGYSHEAIDLFEKLPAVGLRPDPITYIGVLTACSHAGLVDLAFRYFDTMSVKHQIIPTKEHYGCMIDLLCRAGRLNEAENIIKNMPFKRDDVVWSTLLRACRVHGDVDRGRLAAEQILELDPHCAGTHIMLANIYSAQGRWREAADIRKMMKSKGVIKEPGWSWIKVKERVSTFVAGDRTPLEHEEIYNTLDFLRLDEIDVNDVDIFLDDVGD